MAESRSRFRQCIPHLRESREAGVKADLAQTNHHFDVWEKVEFGPHVVGAARQLLRCRLVLRRRTADGCSEIGVDHCESVAAALGTWRSGEACTEQRAGEPSRGPVTGEHTARSIAAVCCGSEADEQHAGVDPSKRRHRLAPVRLAGEFRLAAAGDLGAIFTQLRAPSAADDRPANRGDGFRPHDQSSAGRGAPPSARTGFLVESDNSTARADTTVSTRKASSKPPISDCRTNSDFSAASACT
jgi:hypothetical protein